MNKQYHSLESEKYMLASIRQDKREARRQARASIGNAIFNTFLMFLAAFAGFLAVKTMPDWLPVVQTQFHELTNYRYF